ncbi:MAG: hypothetical protein K2I81_02430 [Alphaproteobacteria bacterium]|nr:hypothetical protein [Alphaproteobacteria bacterium]
MNRAEIQSYLEKRFPGEPVKYVGAGTDSTAFKVGAKICRFPHHNAAAYEMEAALCDFIRPNISVAIPSVNIVRDGDIVFAVHDMITGGKWSWHKFSWSPLRQRNLSRSYARFLAQLHGVDAVRLQRAVPGIGGGIPYCDIDEIADFLNRFMTPGQMKFFRRNYERIVGAPVKKEDIVFVHMGLKGANSVVADDGGLCGVFDFCSGGLYERGRDFVLSYLGRNSGMFRSVLREYNKLTGGRAPSAARVKDLAVIEFLWRRRLFPNGVFQPRNDHFIMKNIAVALARFHRLPKPLYWIIYLRMLWRLRRGISA